MLLNFFKKLYLNRSCPINHDILKQMKSPTLNYNIFNISQLVCLEQKKKVNVVVVANNDTIDYLLFSTLGIEFKSSIRTPHSTTYFIKCSEEIINDIKKNDNVYGVNLI